MGFRQKRPCACLQKFPLRPRDRDLSYIAPFSPIDAEWYAWRPMALLSGSAADVPNYNTTTRAVSGIVTNVSGFPIIAFYDDYGGRPINNLALHDTSAFLGLSMMLGVILNFKQTSTDNDTVYLGLRGISPPRANGAGIFISLSNERASQIVAILDAALCSLSITYRAMGRLVGKLGFSKTAI